MSLAHDAVMSIVEENPMPLWQFAAKMIGGWHALLNKEYQTACPVLTDIIAEHESLNFRMFRPNNLCHLAESYLGIGDLERGLECVAEAFKEIELGRDNWYEAELHRIRGRVMEARNETNTTVEECYQDALSAARSQSARLFELRAAIDLARYWRHEKRAIDARALLEPIYNWFTEGFDAPDLRAAKTLLRALGAPSDG
jgi:predicted ATPase